MILNKKNLYEKSDKVLYFSEIFYLNSNKKLLMRYKVKIF
jgi:hypothetical protein